MGKLLMVGCGWMGRPYLGRAHARGLDVMVLDTAAALSWDETKAALGPGDRGYPVTATDDEGWLAAASAALSDDTSWVCSASPNRTSSPPRYWPTS